MYFSVAIIISTSTSYRYKHFILCFRPELRPHRSMAKCHTPLSTHQSSSIAEKAMPCGHLPSELTKWRQYSELKRNNKVSARHLNKQRRYFERGRHRWRKCATRAAVEIYIDAAVRALSLFHRHYAGDIAFIELLPGDIRLAVLSTILGWRLIHQTACGKCMHWGSDER